MSGATCEAAPNRRDLTRGWCAGATRRGNAGVDRVLVFRMKAITYSQPGDSSVLSLAERPLPEPGAGEVRVRIVVSGVNPTDWKARASTDRPLAFDEVTPNQDGAGIVDAVGDGVEGLSVGQRVWVYLAAHQRPTGTAAEYSVLPAERAVPLADAASFELGASLGVPAMTAHRALTVHEDGPSRLAPGALSGRTVLVQGGAGAVGHAAIQLAVWAGATVIATVSSDAKEALARAAGAHHVLRYPNEALADGIRELAPNGVEHIVEVAIADNAGLDVEVIANHGTIGYYADNGGDAFTAAVRASFAKNVRWQGLLLYTVGERALAAAAEDVSAAVAAGALPVGEEAGLPLSGFPLDQTAAAHDAVEAGVTGKVLIRVADER